MENIIIRNEKPLWANMLLMYIITKGDIYKLPHINGTNYINAGNVYNKIIRNGD
jgi:hypothetical protein